MRECEDEGEGCSHMPLVLTHVLVPSPRSLFAHLPRHSQSPPFLPTPLIFESFRHSPLTHSHTHTHPPFLFSESLWPATIGPTGNGGAVLQKNYTNPRVTVHVTTGNGGPPGKDSFCADSNGPPCNISSTNVQSTEFSYGRITAHNASHFTFQQLFNSNGSVLDEFTIIQDTHGPFDQTG